MQSMRQMNFEESFKTPINDTNWTKKANDEKLGYGASLNSQRGVLKPYPVLENNNYQFLDSKHLDMLDLNKNVVNMLPKPMKQSTNLENVCKETTEAAKQTRSRLLSESIQGGVVQQQREQLKQETYNYVNNIYELGNCENNMGTYIQPLYNNKSFDINGNAFNLQGTPFVTPSPFFHPPKFHKQMMNIPSTQVLPMDMKNKCTNIYGLPNYLIPDNKPQNFTVTVVPNKNKDILEKEARYLKQLLDNAAEGVVNSSADYQNVIPPSYFSKNRNVFNHCSELEKLDNKILSENSSNYINNSNNDVESDFSFGKTDNLESIENNQEILNFHNTNNSFNNYLYESNDHLARTSESITSPKNDEAFNLSSNKTLEENTNDINNKTNTSDQKKYDKFNGSANFEEKYKDLENRYGKLYGDRYKGSKSNTKVLPAKKILSEKKKENENSSQNKINESSTHGKKHKNYSNIRLGRPKKMYDTNSSDPIDKKLKEWHNSHNSQVEWKKIKRGIYSFGKTEVLLALNHNKLIIKQINGKPIKDNLLTLEKFVSLNELFEIEHEHDAAKLN